MKLNSLEKIQIGIDWSKVCFIEWLVTIITPYEEDKNAFFYMIGMNWFLPDDIV
jgi:hypothetical protein